MNLTRTGLLLGMLCLGPFAPAADWPAIPPEVWAIKATGAPGEKGAVILERNMRFGVKDTEVTERIRIYGEAGREAVVMTIVERAPVLEGRTVLPDGTVTVFNGAKDLVPFTAQLGYREVKGKVLVPPGLSADCVVDLHYVIGSYLFGYWVKLPILAPFPIKKSVMQLTTMTRLGSILEVPKDFEVWPVNKGPYRVFTFTNLPAEENEPFSVPSLSRPRFIFFMQPPILQMGPAQGPESYWREAAQKVYKPVYTKELSFGRRYREWSRELRAGLSGDPVAQATELCLRLQERIKNSSKPTRAEAAALTDKEAKATVTPRDLLDLDRSVELGRTPAMGLHYLFYQLLVDQGLEPRLLLVSNRKHRPFLPNFRCVFQFTDILIGVPEAGGKLVWFDPRARFLPPGVLDAGFQDVEALVLEPKDWSAKVLNTGAQPSSRNERQYDFQVRLGEAETYTMKAAFTGLDAFEARNGLAFLDPAEQERTLKEQVEKLAPEVTVTRASIENTADPRKPFSLALEGTRPFEGGRRREVEPFPGLAAPLPLPEAWPSARVNPIVLPHRFRFTASSRIQVPEGWTVAEAPGLDEENFFGRVSWHLKALPDHWVEVTCSVTVETLVNDNVGYPAFKRFMGWVDQAYRKHLLLERP